MNLLNRAYFSISPTTYTLFFFILILNLSQFTLASSSTHSTDDHLDMYDAINLIDQKNMKMQKTYF